MRFDNKIAIITGATGPLGSVLVRNFLSEGARVAVSVHRQRKLATLDDSKAESLQNLLPVEADLAVEEDARAFVDRVLDEWKQVDFLLHTVGLFAGGKRVEEVSEEEWDRMLDVNVKSAFLICKAVLPVMRERGFGRIVTVGAMPALKPVAKRGPYQIAKRALITLTESIAEEVKGTGVTANVVVPSTILTRENMESMPDADTSKWVPPEEIASLMAYLCTPEARSINGNTIKIYGGI